MWGKSWWETHPFGASSFNLEYLFNQEDPQGMPPMKQNDVTRVTNLEVSLHPKWVWVQVDLRELKQVEHLPYGGVSLKYWWEIVINLTDFKLGIFDFQQQCFSNLKLITWCIWSKIQIFCFSTANLHFHSICFEKEKFRLVIHKNFVFRQIMNIENNQN